MQRTSEARETQTGICVGPSLLEFDQTATVFNEMGIQASKTRLPNDCISNISPQLNANPDDELHKTGNEEEPEEVTGEEEVGEGRGDSECNEKQEETKASSKSVTSSCQCTSQLINNVAAKLRAHAATLKVTPKVFPPETNFEDRITNVLNSTLSILQTEMANLLEVYLEENNVPCGCGVSQAYNTCECLEETPTVGDGKYKKDSISVECECCPNASGAAAPSLPTESELDLCCCAKISGPKKTIKFQFVTKNNINDLESSSAIIVNAPISCPQTGKPPKMRSVSEFSLPDLRDQTITVSVIYKNDSSELNTTTEELLNASCNNGN